MSRLTLLLFSLALVGISLSHSYPKNPYRFRLRPQKSHVIRSSAPKLNRYQSKTIKIPIHRKHELKFRQYPNGPEETAGELTEEPKIEVSAKATPLSLVFRSSSSPLDIRHVHEPKGSYETKSSYSVDQPQYLEHKVVKPIYQFVHEVIQPKRSVVAEVVPVQDVTNTLVATPTSRLYGQPLEPSVEPVLLISPENIETKLKPATSVKSIQVYQEPEEAHVRLSTSPENLIPATLTPLATSPLLESSPSHQQLTSTPTLIPVTNDLLATYLRYSQLTTDDLLLPVYQATSTSTTTTQGHVVPVVGYKTDGASTTSLYPFPIKTTQTLYA